MPRDRPRKCGFDVSERTPGFNSISICLMITTTVPAYRGPILALIAFPLRYTREAAAVVGSSPVVVVASIVSGYLQSLRLIPEISSHFSSHRRGHCVEAIRQIRLLPRIYKSPMPCADYTRWNHPDAHFMPPAWHARL